MIKHTEFHDNILDSGEVAAILIDLIVDRSWLTWLDPIDLNIMELKSLLPFGQQLKLFQWNIPLEPLIRVHKQKLLPEFAQNTTQLKHNWANSEDNNEHSIILIIYLF